MINYKKNSQKTTKKKKHCAKRKTIKVKKQHAGNASVAYKEKKRSKVITWIINNYICDSLGGSEIMAHTINKHLINKANKIVAAGLSTFLLLGIVALLEAQRFSYLGCLLGIILHLMSDTISLY